MEKNSVRNGGRVYFPPITDRINLVLKREFLKRIRLLYHLTTQIPLFSQVQILAHPAVFWAYLRHNLWKDPLEAGGSVSCLQNSFDCLQSCCCCCRVVGWKRERERERVYFTNKPYLEMACSCGTWYHLYWMYQTNAILVWCLINGWPLQHKTESCWIPEAVPLITVTPQVELYRRPWICEKNLVLECQS